MSRFQRSWQLFKSSLAVMGRNRQLVLFPIVIAVLTSFIALLFLAGFTLQPTGHPYASAEHWRAVGASVFGPDASDAGGAAHYSRGGAVQMAARANPLALAYFAVAYFVSMFCATFFNVAFYQQILRALNGQPVSIPDGLRFACTRWKAILMWTLFAGAVGYLIRTLEQRFGFIGRLILGLLGTAWSIACVFVIPVIITEADAVNPFAVLKKSAITLRQTWGESLIGYAGVSLGSGLLVLLSLVWLAAGIGLAVVLQSIWLGAAVFAVWLLGVIVLGYLTGIASQIFRCALYLYATQGTLPQPYDEQMMQMAWKVKKACAEARGLNPFQPDTHALLRRGRHGPTLRGCCGPGCDPSDGGLPRLTGSLGVC